MINFHFISSEKFDLNNFKNIEAFVESFPDFQTVTLNNDNELSLLLKLMSVSSYEINKLDVPEFTEYWDISNFKLPEFDENQFNQFYKSWLQASKRDNNMDEYGNLIFLRGLSTEWNKNRFRLILKDKV